MAQTHLGSQTVQNTYDDYKDYMPVAGEVIERVQELSDRVAIKILDFRPKDCLQSRPLLFVAGWISLIDGWKSFLPIFTAKQRVIYVETREKISAKLPADASNIQFDMDRMVLDLKEVVAAEGFNSGDYDLAGSSLGATTIAEFLARKDVVLPKRAALIAPNADFPFPKWALPIMRYFPNFLWTVMKPVAKWYMRKFKVESPEQAAKYEKTLDYADIYKLRRNAITLIDYKIWPKLPHITVPTLVIGASADKMHGLENINLMGEKITNATVKTLPSNKATHAEPCAQLIDDYFNH